MQFVLQNSSPNFFFEKKNSKASQKKQKKRDPNKFFIIPVFIKQEFCLDSLAEKDIADNLALTLNEHCIIPRQ